jgi:DNA-directed RNA polymerase subunit RPC12/RpoP
MSDEKGSEKTGRTSFAQAAKKPVARALSGVQCLRCKHEIDNYVFTKLTFLPYGTQSGNVMLECPKCGHLEFLSQSSPLLQRLKANPVAVGDGD